MKANSDIQANARAYALEALKNQLQAVEQAYIQGYNDAMAMIPREPIEEGKDKFQDAGLDSGTMWIQDLSHDGHNYRYLGYYDALMYGIPTKDQFDELFSRSKYKESKSGNYPYFVSPSSAEICCRKYDNKIWVRSDVVNDEALSCLIRADGSHEYIRNFVGEKLQILRVKNKNEE